MRYFVNIITGATYESFIRPNFLSVGYWKEVSYSEYKKAKKG